MRPPALRAVLSARAPLVHPPSRAAFHIASARHASSSSSTPRGPKSGAAPSPAPPAPSTTASPSSSSPTTSASSSTSVNPAPSPRSDTNGKSKAKAKSTPVVPPLSRPPGVPRKPEAREKTWAERKADLLNEERHKAKRRALLKEASQGYFHDFNRAKSASGGKLWIAPPVLIREDKALYFPNISGKSLLGEVAHTTDILKGRVSLLSMVSARISEEHVASYAAPLLSEYAGSPLFQHVQINHQTNALKSMLLSLFVSSLKRQVKDYDWGRYLVCSGEWNQFDVSGPLGIENSIIGYVFLIDPNLKVRWAACGPATEKEAQDLRTATATMMRRELDKLGQGAGAGGEVREAVTPVSEGAGPSVPA